MTLKSILQSPIFLLERLKGELIVLYIITLFCYVVSGDNTAYFKIQETKVEKLLSTKSSIYAFSELDAGGGGGGAGAGREEELNSF